MLNNLGVIWCCSLSSLCYTIMYVLGCSCMSTNLIWYKLFICMLISVVLHDFSSWWCFTHFISCCYMFIYGVGVDDVSQQILYFIHGIHSCLLLLWYRLFLRIFQSRQDFLLILGAICGLKLVRMLRGIDLFDLGVAYVNEVL